MMALFRLRSSPRRSMVTRCDIDGDASMAAAAWIRVLGLALGRRNAANGRRARLSIPDVSHAIPVSETSSTLGNRLLVLEAKTLIARLEAGSLIDRIGDHSHASSDNFRRHYATVIDRFLEFAQLLPASESHHHAQPGGMAPHTLGPCNMRCSGGRA